MKKHPVMPTPETRDGKKSASTPLVPQPKNTEMPMPKPRMCSGKISASQTHTATFKKVCMDITKATTKINDSYYSLAQYNTPAWRRLVTCQEIAHDFGLDHQDENFNNANLGTCMDYTSDPDGPPTNEHPNSHDFAQLQTIYGHTDASTTIASAVAATDFGIRTPGGRAPAAPIADNESGDSPADWGRAIHTDGLGRPDVFVKDLGAGHKKITHVFWALGEGPNGRHHD